MNEILKKRIEEAALLRCASKDEVLTDFGTSCFIEDGAEWRINSVWHSADEEPETGRMILVMKCIARNHVSYQLKVKEALPYWERGARFIGGWAYLSDLLPTENAENFQRNSADFPRKFRECRKTSSGGKEAEQ